MCYCIVCRVLPCFADPNSLPLRFLPPLHWAARMVAPWRRATCSEVQRAWHSTSTYPRFGVRLRFALGEREVEVEIRRNGIRRRGGSCFSFACYLVFFMRRFGDWPFRFVFERQEQVRIYYREFGEASSTSSASGGTTVSPPEPSGAQVA